MTNTPTLTSAGDVRWLADQHQVMAELADDTRPLHQQVASLRTRFTPNQVAQLLEQRELRTRAAAKFRRAERMLFTRRGYEQATDEWLAAYKARRFAALDSVADLCCGIGGDTAALAVGEERLVACDRDEVMLAVAAHNVGQMLEPERGRQVEWVREDVRNLPVENVDAWHIDPDRRTERGRTTHAAYHEPDDRTIDDLRRRNPHAAIKLAPGGDPPAEWAAEGELEWISRGGECRQLVVWLGNLATAPGKRRATLLLPRSFEPAVTLVGEVSELPYTDQVGQFCYEPDPAVLAADLVGWLARDLHLAAFAATHGYLTGSEPVEHPALKGYEVLEMLPLQVKRVAAALRQRGIGRLVVKQRGVDLETEQLIRQLKLKGDNAGVLMVTRMGERRMVLICRTLSREAR